MSIVQIEHVQLAMPPSKEPDARRFYTLGLGLDEVRKPENLAARGGCWFELGNVRVHLGIDTDFRPAKKAHPAFVVTDLDALCKKLDGLGYTLADDQPLKGFRRTYVADPFGNRIELMQPEAGT